MTSHNNPAAAQPMTTPPQVQPDIQQDSWLPDWVVNWLNLFQGEFSQLSALDKLTYFAATILPIVIAIYTIFAFFLNRGPFNRKTGLGSQPPPPPPNNPISQEGEIVAREFDLLADYERQVLQRLLAAARQ